ncbi:MAG TPA: DUF4347 domain-containing protein, partial [Ramlibacter sp.]|nr:DUF4347 domain-containing protein [Ramlibacter sp.]
MAELAVPAAVEPPRGEPTPVEWLVIDGRVPDAQLLVDSARSGMQVLLLDPGRDGIQQIQQALAQDGRPVSGLHVVSHGAPGFLQLGLTGLNASALEARAGELSALGQHLAADADLLLYGCDVAGTAAGEQFVDRLAQLTGADVAASRDATGAAARNGNWTFEYATGAVDPNPFLSDAGGASYSATLPIVDLAGKDNWTPLLYGSRQDPAGDMQAAAASTDIVGDGNLPTLFYAYEDSGTSAEGDDNLLFRFRVSGPNSQNRFGSYGVIGIDTDLNGDIDIFIIAKDDSNGPTIGLYNP